MHFVDDQILDKRLPDDRLLGNRFPDGWLLNEPPLDRRPDHWQQDPGPNSSDTSFLTQP